MAKVIGEMSSTVSLETVGNGVIFVSSDSGEAYIMQRQNYSWAKQNPSHLEATRLSDGKVMSLLKHKQVITCPNAKVLLNG